MSLALEIHRIGREAVERRGGGRLDGVKVAVGELAAVEPRLLLYAWEALTAEGPDRGARLEVDWRPARQFCAACGEPKTRAAGSWLRICPDCGGTLAVDGGSELDVIEVWFTAHREEGETSWTT